jgi:heavy metal efflux system protein
MMYRSKVVKIVCLAIILGTTSEFVSGQNYTMDSLLQITFRNNPEVAKARLETSRENIMTKTAWDVAKTDVSLTYGQYNSFHRNDNNFTITQEIPSPVAAIRQRKLYGLNVNTAQVNEDLIRNEIALRVRTIYNELLFLHLRKNLLMKRDSLMKNLLRIAEVQYRTGESPLLTKTSAETQLAEVKNLLSRNSADIEVRLNALGTICGCTVSGVDGDLRNTAVFTQRDSVNFNSNPTLRMLELRTEAAAMKKKVEAAKAFPDFRVAYFNQTLIGYQTTPSGEQYYGPSDRFQGFQVAVALPLWFAPYRNRIRAEGASEEIARKEQDVVSAALRREHETAMAELRKNENSLVYYRDSALPNADALVKQSNTAFRNGEIDYRTLLLNLQQAIAVEEGYLDTLLEYHNNQATLLYLSGQIENEE